MKVAQKWPEEKPGVEELKGRLLDRFADRLKHRPHECTLTSFGVHHDMVREAGRRILEFRNHGETIAINEIGAGMEERSGIAVLGRSVTKRNAVFEPFELLNEVRKAGIKPEEFALYVMDIRKDALLAVKATKVLMVHAGERNSRYFQEFFPDSHEKERGGFIPVRIPKEYRERIICPKPLDIEKTPAPVKAHVTFSYIPAVLGNSRYSDNLVKSTRGGGYILCQDFDDAVAKRFGLEAAQHPELYFSIYRVR